jgi:hypothetical protein
VPLWSICESKGPNQRGGELRAVRVKIFGDDVSHWTEEEAAHSTRNGSVTCYLHIDQVMNLRDNNSSCSRN